MDASMSQHKRFHYKTIGELIETLTRLGINLPTSDDFGILAKGLEIGSKTVPNRFVTQPMEGCDCTNDGTPTDLTRRRYLRFGSGGAGLIWFEACAVVPEGRANPRQMMLTEQNLDVFKKMLDECRGAAVESMGVNHEPICILQLTHAGRYSRPEGRLAPIIAHHSKVLDPLQNIDPDYPLISDDALDQLQDAYVHAAHLAAEAGFDGVDIKSCHGYLLSELLASYTREDSRYGGPEFDNRTRFLREAHRLVVNEVSELIVTSRINAYDAVYYPYGWGVDENSVEKPNLDEPIQLTGILKKQGAACLNMSIGNPYFASHFGRPYDVAIVGGRLPDEHPLIGVNRIIQIARELQLSHPGLPLIGSGYTYFREFLPWFAAGILKERWASMIGLGREAFAYPQFAKDILRRGSSDPSKVCITCSRCSQIMRDGGKAGCVVRDAKIYGPIYREGRKGAR